MQIGLAIGVTRRSGKAGPPPTPAPANTVAPVISGTPSVGSVLNTTNGTWTGSPAGYTYQWRADGVAIVGATASTYTVVLADDGKNITCAVTATNAGGSASAVSNALGPVTSGPTYAEFVAHITGLAPALFGWSDGVGSVGAGSSRVVVGGPEGDMAGSSWESTARYGTTNVSRFIQHALPDPATMTAITGTQVMFTRGTAANTARPGLDRNGYLSTASTAGGHVSCTLCAWYDPVLGPMKNDPSIGTGPTPYTW